MTSEHKRIEQLGRIELVRRVTELELDLGRERVLREQLERELAEARRHVAELGAVPLSKRPTQPAITVVDDELEPG